MLLLIIAFLFVVGSVRRLRRADPVLFGGLLPFLGGAKRPCS